MNKSLFFFVFCCALLCGGFAQQTKSEPFEYRAPYVDLRPVQCTKQYVVDGAGRLQGTWRIKGNDMVRGGAGYNEQRYEEVRHYEAGVLQGAFSQSYSHSGRGNALGPYRVQRCWTAKGQFEGGHPDGKWTFTLNSNMNTSLERSVTNYSYTLTFERGVLRCLTDEKGRKLQFHEDGTFSGKVVVDDWRGVEVSHSVVSNVYQNDEGKWISMTPRLRRLLDSTTSVFVMADSGYAVDYRETKVVQVARCADIINRYLRLPAIDSGVVAAPLSVVGVLRSIAPVPAGEAYDFYIQTPRSADRMLKNGYYERRGKRYFMDSESERRIRQHVTKYACDMLSHKLEFLVSLMGSHTWKDILNDCREGHSPLLDMVAAKWTSAQYERQCKESAELIDRGFGNLYPLRGFGIVSARYVPYRGLDAEVAFYVVDADSIQYTTKVVPVKTDVAGNLLIGQIDASAYRVVPNLWDTVSALESQLNAQHTQLLRRLSCCGEWREEYESLYDSVYMDKTILPEVRMEDLRYLESVQKDMMTRIEDYQKRKD